MKKLLSLPSNLVNYFHAIEEVSREDYFCTSDPVGARLGSGGGTAWLLEECRKAESPEVPFAEWLSREKRILLHAAGESRRLPGYASSGKLLTPIPVFRWARGQRLSQHLMSLQLPLYERVMQMAPEGLRTLIASGDVFIRYDQHLPEIPEADVVCFGLWVDPALAVNHGVFVSDRRTPDRLECMLQKPSLARLGELSGTHLFLMDIGLWLLSDRAVGLLMERAKADNDLGLQNYDLYGTFGLALGENPLLQDKEIQDLSVAILSLPKGEFYHYGTSRELITSTLALQNRVNDQRYIMHRKVKPHPAIFVQNAIMCNQLTAMNADLWIENSFMGKDWELSNKHVITGVPVNDWELRLPSGVCVDVVPVGEEGFVARPYGFTDAFRGDIQDSSTLFMERPFVEWAKERDIELLADDIQDAALFPLCDTVEELGVMLRWMITEPESKEVREVWLQKRRFSANELSDKANLRRLYQQRVSFRKENWPLLASHYRNSVFYQLDLADAAREFVKYDIPLPAELPVEIPSVTRMQDAMFRSKVNQLRNQPWERDAQQAFALLSEGLQDALLAEKQHPVLNVFPDQIVWGRSPVRIDLAGGWTDTPPYCLYEGGIVVNMAIELNEQPPLQVYVKPTKDTSIILRSIDLGATEKIESWEQLRSYNQVGSPFSIPKAALALAGFLPEFSERQYHSLQEQLKAFGAGLELTLLSAVPAGSGLGTSSILAATVLGAVSDFCGLGWDKNRIGERTLILEQLLTTGGGWQDQFGGILHGVKLLQTEEGMKQMPLVRWLPDSLFAAPDYQSCHLLYYTGITRVAKGILSEIVRNMFLNSREHLSLLAEMKAHAMDLYEAVQQGDFVQYGHLVKQTWAQNKALDSGTNPPEIEKIIALIDDYTLGYKLPGAGGGGFLYMVAKDMDAAAHIRRILTDTSLHPNARFVNMRLSQNGLQISRS